MKNIKKEKNGKKNKEKDEKKKIDRGIYFLLAVALLYAVLFLFNPETIEKSVKASFLLFIKMVPALIMVVLFMGALNYFFTPKDVMKYAGKGSGAKGWFLAAATGILSHGPVYMWYPVLKELMDSGMRSGLAAVFLYNRAIKIPLLPLMVYYFGILFVVVLLFYTLIASFAQGKLIEIIEGYMR